MSLHEFSLFLERKMPSWEALVGNVWRKIVPFQILALDGGGLKGIFSAAVLASIEADLGVNIRDHFDLIAGTSTGGIIALGLGLGLSPRDILKFYVEDGRKIFRNSLSLRGWQHYFRRKYSGRALENSLRRIFGESRLVDSQKRLVIPSYNLGEDAVHIFKTPHHLRFQRDWKVPVWQVAMATSAAPTYFPTFQKVDSMRLIDGGVWANNPTLVGIIEAVSVLDIDLSAIRILSLGTVDAVTHRPTSLNSGGLWQWRKHAADVILRGQSLGVQAMARHLVGNDAIHRLEPRVPDGLYTLDGHNAESLVAKAAHESRIFSPKFAEHFRGHTASRYDPCDHANERNV